MQISLTKHYSKFRWMVWKDTLYDHMHLIYVGIELIRPRKKFADYFLGIHSFQVEKQLRFRNLRVELYNRWLHNTLWKITEHIIDSCISAVWKIGINQSAKRSILFAAKYRRTHDMDGFYFQESPNMVFFEAIDSDNNITLFRTIWYWLHRTIWYWLHHNIWAITWTW